MKAKIAILTVLVYFTTLLINLPASLLVSFMPESAIKIEGVSGSVWQGQAKQVSIDPKMTFDNITWDVNFMSLLSLALQANVAFDNGSDAMSGKAVVEYGLSGPSASNVMLDLTSQQLLTFLPMPLPVKISGDFSAAIKEVKQGQPYCELLKGVVVWHDAVVYSQMGDVKLASPSIDLRCDNGNISALVTQDSEQLKSTIDILLSEGGSYKLNGEIQGTDKLEPAIAQSLSWVGAQNESGATTINFEGKL